MSAQPPSIPTSPPPGKDPPSSSSTAPAPASATQHFLPISSENDRPPSTTPDLDTKNSADTKAMPPPPPPSQQQQHRPKPLITTQRASSSNVHSFSESQATATAVQNADLQTSKEREKERPPFAPFFTLVNDLSNGEQSTHHPAQVHYLFSDDDASEVLTGALVRSMNPHTSPPSASPSQSRELETSTNTTSSGSSTTFRKDGTRIRGEKGRSGKDKGKGRDPTGKEREERVVIVDINDAGDGITNVSSLTPSWAVLSAEIGKAPTWDGAEQDGDQQAGTGGLMLKIGGVGLDCGDAGTFGAGAGGGVGGGGKGKGRDDGGKESVSGVRESGIGEDEMQALLEGFDRKMGVLRRVVRLGSRESLVEGEQS